MKNIDKEIVTRFLILENKSKKDLAKYYDCDMGTINRFIIKHNLATDRCLYCGKYFHSHSNAIKYCSDFCRVMAYVNKTESCWVWTGSKIKQGYGRVRINNKLVLAHRFIFEYFNGPILEKILVCHKCDNPSCINPDHLFLGTQQDNVRDASEKGRCKTNTNKRNSKPFLTDEQIIQIRTEYIKNNPGFSLKALGKKYNVHYTTIGHIVNKSGPYWSIR